MIHILDNWYVDTDKYNWILFRKDTIKDEKSKNYGQEVCLEESFHGSLEQAVRHLCRHKHREFGKKKTMELNEYADIIDKSNQNLYNKIKKNIGEGDDNKKRR